MKLVLLGGTGFIGRHLVARLVDAGHDVLVLSRNRERHREMCIAPVRVVSTDLYSKDVLAQRIRGADAVINLVGILNERGSNGDGFRRAHVELTRGLIDACRDAGVKRLIQMSAVNAGRGDSHYLKTRGEAEKLVEQSGLDWTVFRASVVFGPGDGLYCRFAKLLRIMPVLPLARADTRFSPVWVGDVVSAFERALGDARTVRRTFELGGPEVLTLAQIVRDTRDTLGLRRAIVPLPDFLGRLQALACDFIPGKPFSSDNFRTLALDAVAPVDGLRELGIEPMPVAAVVPECLLGTRKQRAYDRYRSRPA